MELVASIVGGFTAGIWVWGMFIYFKLCDINNSIKAKTRDQE